MPGNRVGELVKEWRTRRRRSQLDLAVEVGVSARHLSFVETGRSRPSPELVLALAHHLEVPLREQNSMLMAAGYAPRYLQTPMDAERLTKARESIQRLLDSHDPYPGVAVDRLWNVVAANRGAGLLTRDLPAHVLEPELNVFRVSLHPEGLASMTLNFAEWAAYLLAQLSRSIRATGDHRLQELEQEILAYENIRELATTGPIGSANQDSEVLIPIVLDVGTDRLSLFTTLTTFGTPQDITLDELVVELFYPSDDTSAHLLDSAVARLPK